MIEDVEDYFVKGCGRCPRFKTDQCSVQLWRDGVLKLREICLSVGLTETVKWGHPCYTFAGRNIALIGALRPHYLLTFMNASLLADTANILVKPGPNAQTPSTIYFNKVDQIIDQYDIIKSYLNEAISYAHKGILPQKAKFELDLPEELRDALDVDPVLSEAFYALTPGRQRSYVITINAAKLNQTRLARIEKYRPQILAGKGAQER